MGGGGLLFRKKPSPSQGLSPSNLSIPCRGGEGGFDAEEAVVFGDALTAAGRAGFDEMRVGGNGEVGEGGILGVARAVGGNEIVAVVAGGGDHAEHLGEGSNLIGLDENGQ